MTAAIAILAASLASLDDLAKIVEADACSGPRDFCVTGTVSYVMPYQEKFCHVLVEDGETGVDITGTLGPDSGPLPGDIVRLEGAIVPRGAGSIQPEFVTIETIGRGDPPTPVRGTAGEIMSGRHDFRRAYLVGEVRDVEPSGTDPCWNFLSIISDGRQYYAPIPVRGAAYSELEKLVGSKVRLDGFPDSHTCSFRFLDERRFHVSGMKDIEVLSSPPADPFAKAPHVSGLRRLAPDVLPRLGRHRADGWLMTIWQSHNALLMMPDGRFALVSFSDPVSIRRGQPVEVIGYPSTDGFTLRLSRSMARLGRGGELKAPAPISFSENDFANQQKADFLSKTSLQGKRVTLSGLVAEFGDGQRERMTLPLSVTGRLLEVDISSAPGLSGKIVSGCRVSVTGTCVLETENWAALSTGTQLGGIRLVVDSADDVVVVSRPSWWTLRRLALLVALLLVIMALILIWNSKLRQLSEKRGRELFRERSASALAELKTAERTRLAADIHDSISQILTGAAMQLDAGETNAAKRILASCRRELRACLWDLRNHALDAPDFADAVRETLAPHLGGRVAVVEFDIPSDKMSEAMRHTALCIIREATVNAVRHGRAETIEITGSLEGHRLSFTVSDDGRGFDPASCRGSSDGHFGILGMRERAKAFLGSVQIESAPGSGTKVSVILEEEGGI